MQKVTLYTVDQNNRLPQNDFAVTIGVLKIYLQDFSYLYFYQFQTVGENFMEIDGIFTNYRHFKV